jgi:hypothetical protein
VLQLMLYSGSVERGIPGVRAQGGVHLLLQVRTRVLRRRRGGSVPGLVSWVPAAAAGCCALTPRNLPLSSPTGRGTNSSVSRSPARGAAPGTIPACRAVLPSTSGFTFAPRPWRRLEKQVYSFSVRE